MVYHAGMDASGTSDLRGTEKRHDPYIVVLAGVKNLEILSVGFAAVRARFGMRANAELHGHAMSDEILCAALDAGTAADWRIGALRVDKAAARDQWGNSPLPAPIDFQQMAALRLVEHFVAQYELTELRFDEDTQNRKRQQELITAIKRLHRAVWPERRLRVQPMPSHKSDLIQLADVIAYSLGIEARGTIRTPELQTRMKAFRADASHFILGWEIGKE